MPSYVLQKENSTIPDRPPSSDISNPDPKDGSHQEDIQNSELAPYAVKEKPLCSITLSTLHIKQTTTTYSQNRSPTSLKSESSNSRILHK